MYNSHSFSFPRFEFDTSEYLIVLYSGLPVGNRFDMAARVFVDEELNSLKAISFSDLYTCAFICQFIIGLLLFGFIAYIHCVRLTTYHEFYVFIELVTYDNSLQIMKVNLLLIIRLYYILYTHYPQSSRLVTILYNLCIYDLKCSK